MPSFFSEWFICAHTSLFVVFVVVDVADDVIRLLQSTSTNRHHNNDGNADSDTQMDNPNDPAIAHLFPPVIAIYKPVSHASQTRRTFLTEGYRAPLVRGVDECQ